MALRLASAAKTPAPIARADRALVDRARAALRARELHRLTALAEEAGALTGPDRAYVVRRALVEHALAEAAAARGPEAARLLLAAARAGLVALAASPSEPVLLNLTGVALYELGALRGAEALFAAAGRLDPELPHVERNLREVARRRRGSVRTDVPPDVALALPDLGRAAATVAGRAAPAAPGRISLCMIVRDEEAVLARCLAAARPFVDEIVVVDTGSTDRTVAIAEEHGAVVLHHAWSDSFAEARNVGVAAATGDWILWLDADEVLVAQDGPRLRDLTRRSWREAFLVTITNYVGGADTGLAVAHDAQRLFRARPDRRFEGRIHEGIAHSLPTDAPERCESAGVRVEHYGYLLHIRDAKGKSSRNRELLEQQVREGDTSPFTAYNLGTEHAIADDPAAAAGHFARALEQVAAFGGPTVVTYGPSLVQRHVTALRAAGRRREADAAADAGLAELPDFTDLVLEQAHLAIDEGDAERAETLLRRCLALGDAPSRYCPTIGAGTFLAATALAGVRFRAGDVDGAARLLEDTLAEHPRYLGVVEPLATVLLAAGRPPADVVAAVAARCPLTPAVRFVLGAAFHEQRHLAEAEAELRAVVAADPHAAPARIALAEALLSQARWAEAADAAAAVPVESPLARAATVSEAFGRVLAGDRAGAERALARAAQAGTPDPYRELLGAWSVVAGVGDWPETLPAGAAGLLLTFLEALLRVEAVDAFVALLPALARVDGVDRRTRRLVLADLYERRGLLESAAEEWLACVQEDGASARALHGLARVAAAQGAEEDARVLAEEARALEPA